MILAVSLTAWGADRGGRSRSVQRDDYWHYLSVGNLGLTVTNFGILGQGYNNPDQPSCWYKLRSTLPKEQVEHFSYAGIWIGGVKEGQTRVSTGIMDGVFGYSDGGWEYTASATDEIADTPIFRHLASIDRRYDFSGVTEDGGELVFGGSVQAPKENGVFQFSTTNWDTIVTRSSIADASLNNPYWPYARVFDPNAVSHQDLICAYTDTNVTVPGEAVSIPNHTPLGVHVYQEAYAWKDPFADSFGIINFVVTNIPDGWRIAESDETVDYGSGVVREFAAGDTVWLGEPIVEPYFAYWFDSSVGNTIYTDPYSSTGGPGGRWNWYDNLNDYDPSRNLGLQYDYDGDAGWAQSYFGIKFLGAESVLGDSIPDNFNTYYHQWTWQGTTYGSDFPMPRNEQERYEVMGNPPLTPYSENPDQSSFQNSWMMLLSAGPFADLAPGERFNVTYAVLAARWNGGGDDSDERRANLYLNAEWAQIAYNGEDTNGNGILDPGEDKDGNGRITRYLLPGAPPSPQLAVVPEDRQVTLYWNDDPESAIDPISSQQDFEGYRIYSSPKTRTDEGQEWTLLADFDLDFDLAPSDDDSTLLGYNTGFGSIHLDSLRNRGLFTQQEVDSLRQMVQSRFGFTPDYRWVNSGVKNGWPRDLYYAVTSYDRGDPANNLQSLESGRTANRTFAYPGTTPTASGDDRIGIYPNPYRGQAEWDGPGGRDRLIWFRYLPERCEISIFNIAGELVDRFEHNSATYQGQDIQRLQSGAAPGERRVYSGGEHAWDLLTSDDQEVATGLYIVTVEDLDTGHVKTGKFLVIK